MKNLLRLEELAQFLLCLFILISNDVVWWCYLLLLLGPDIGMLGYLINTKVGAITYNVLHHKAVGLFLLAIGSIHFFGAGVETMLFGLRSAGDVLVITGLILFGHASMDRIFGYGLKFGDSFHHTHLGWIGQAKGKGPQAQ